MKKFFLLIVMISLIFGCADEKEANQVEVGEIVGEWKLIFVHERSWDSHMADKSDKDIVYKFKSNGILDVSAETVLLKKGQHNYSFGEETITIDGQSYETQIVNIENQKWLYSFSDEQMTISKFDSDGGSLTFVRK